MTETKEKPAAPAACVRHCKQTGQHADTCPDRRICTGCAPQTVSGDSLLCGQCHALFRRVLTDIADMWPTLRAGEKRKAGGNETGRSGRGGHAEVGDFWNPQATIVLIDLESYVGFLLRLAVPADKKLPRLQPHAEKVLTNLRAIPRYFARALSHHTELGPSLLSEALVLRERARQAIDGTFVRRISLPNSLCAAEALAEDVFGEEPVFCGGQLVAIIQPADGGRRSAVVCSNDPRHTVDASAWITHLEQVSRDQADAARAAREQVPFLDAAEPAAEEVGADG